MSFIVAIDGPAGTGKGTMADLLSKKYGFTNIDTGATYRCVALEMLNQKVDLSNEAEVAKIAKNIKIDMQTIDGNLEVYLNGVNVSKEIRSPEVAKVVSPVSSIKEVRSEMVNIQRKLAEGKNVIMEGRDITTVVFPNADVKIYLDGALEERALRRYRQNKAKGIEMSYEEVLENIKKRDKNDMEKEVGALKIADDAIVIDTTNLTISEQEAKMSEIIDKALASKK